GALIAGRAAEHVAADRDIRRSDDLAAVEPAAVRPRTRHGAARRSAGAGRRARLHLPRPLGRYAMSRPAVIRHGALRVLIYTVLCLVVGVIAAPGAQAHAELVSSDPANGARLT